MSVDSRDPAGRRGKREKKGDVRTMIRLSTRDFLTVALVTIALVASGFSVYAASNYSLFYRALDGMVLNITDVKVQATEAHMNGSITFTVRNPTDYQGLSFKTILTGLKVRVDGNGTRDQGVFSSIYSEDDSLGPGSSRTVVVSFVGTLGVPQLVTWAQSHGRTVTLILDTRVLMATFMDRTATITKAYQCSATVAGSGSCQAGSILLSPVGGSGGGAGN